MSNPEHEPDAAPPPPTIDPTAARRVALGALAALAGAFVLYVALRRGTPPPPPEIRDDPLLVEGREVYLARCLGCHGERGRGDGPIARGLAGPSVGDLADGRWKHGDRPEDVLRVIREGVSNTSMPGWGRVLSGDDLRAVAAYTLHLGGRAVPDALRAP